MTAMDIREAADGVPRCWWPGDDPLNVRYHDEEWGFPQGDDVRLFEKVCLEGFQAGLSWITILRKRENFRSAFGGFVPGVVAAYDESDVDRLLADAGIVRHRGKIEATITNAARALELIDDYGSLGAYFWSMEPPRRPAPRELVATSDVSATMSRDLKRRGWRFVGPTTMYAFMQAMGLVNDHLDGCAVRATVEEARTTFVPPLAPTHRDSS
jgi:DNA-3-methyladenine glycosylase I